MGLLDALNTLGIETPDDPMKQQALQRGLLSFGLGLMASKGRLGPAMGQAGLLGMQAYGQDLAAQQAQKGRDLQQKALDLETQQKQRELERQKLLDALPSQFGRTPAQQALANGQGPTVANAQAMDAIQQPKFDAVGYGNALMFIDPMQGMKWQQMLQKPETQDVYDSEGRKVTIGKDGRPLVTGAPKLPEAVQAYQFAVNQGYKGSFEDWSLAQRQAGAQVISLGSPLPVDLGGGQRGYVMPPTKPGGQPQILTNPTTNAPVSPPKEPMSSALQSELIQTDEAIQAGQSSLGLISKALDLNKSAYSGIGASTRATIASNIPFIGKEGANATIELDNLIQQDALSSLKAIFGGNPTEGERKILLDLQASSSKTPEQREALLKNTAAAVQRRLNFAQKKAEAIRGGSYLTEGIGGTGSPASGANPPALSSGPLSQAREAIAKGVPRAAVIQRLRDAGIDPSGL